MARDESNSSGPMDRLKAELGTLVGALGDRAMEGVRHQVEGAADRLTDYVEGGGGPGVMAAVTGARNLAEGKSPVRSMLGAGFAGVKEKVAGMFGKGGKGGGQRKLKLTNIVESIDVGVPVRVAYNQWTQYSDLPKFTKKVENVDQNKDPDEENKTNWKAQVFLSHRTWEATVTEQVPDERIIWRSKGQKGHVDGAVTFHELAPNLTRILLVLEYHPQGLFERTGNIWRAQGRRARLELKHFRRYMMTEGVLHADEVEGWRGTIHDGEIVETHEDAMEREEKDGSQQSGAREEQDGSQRDDSRQAGNARAAATRRRAGQSKTPAAERGEDEDRGDESANRRPARTREGSGASGRTRRSGGSKSPEPASRSRRPAGSRSPEPASRGRGRQRAGASAQRGGS
jgi:uncharacterized membrane protein